MSKGLNQKLKLSMLCKIMQEETDDEHSLTLQQIIKKLEAYDITAERKSLYDDFKCMDENLDVEVIKEQIGRETFYHVGSRQFQLAEVKLLIDAIQSSKFISQNKSKELIKKMKGFVSKYQADKLQRQVYVNDRIKSMNESTYYAVDDIHTAIAENKKVTFQYCSWTVEKNLEPRKNGELYKVSPWALTWADENYYLVAYDSEAGKVKHYRVDKMLHLNKIDELREGKEFFNNFDMGTYALENFSMFGGEIKRVHIEFPNDKVGIFIDRFGKDIAIREAGQDRSMIAVDVAISSQFFGWIFGLGSDVKVTGPEAVVEKMHAEAEAFLSNY
ncbi:Predicted DNA-binding transcriptional regulator YafY, contains an HTH and WYL domains [Pseudobutyrivibrio sp. C4]|uniref:helix-turn-helix transcriptional regulator n=1 Tax=Pseudobutyrivibrio sp. C4 TaxID=1520803 RepID=UPI0008C13E57|nr:WYL domain-containing protein [Pseudobutyrivibrio sp. C4]SES65352.1 Predicted DNA-binding transcriptional regulator YafY, contains an HTH and WYL domains [Pseudobutyrivibrio sp. C4]